MFTIEENNMNLLDYTINHMKYDYKGYEPCGAVDAYIVSQWANGWAGNATESAVENGCIFHVVDEFNAFLESPAKTRAQYVKKNGPVFPMTDTKDGIMVVKEETK
jgi:hypothetical protein